MLTDEQITNIWIWSGTVDAERTSAPTQQHAFARAIEATCKQSLQVEREKAYDALSPDGGVSFVDRQIKLENELKETESRNV